MKAPLAQHSALLNTMMQQIQDLNMRVEAAEEVAAKAASQAGGTAQNGDAELEALNQRPYVPHVAGNACPTRPANLETDMPQMYDLYDKTYDALSKRTNSSMRYEHLRTGLNPRRIVYDLRWLNSFYQKLRCKMETLKNLRRLAKQDDRCFSFDLQDRYHYVGVDPAFHKLMQFDVQGELCQRSALPFGWNESLRVFVQFMKEYADELGEQRIEQQHLVEREPCLDDLFFLASSEEAVHELRHRVDRVLHSLRLRRNVKKGQWERVQLIEHLRLDLQEGELCVTLVPLDLGNDNALSCWTGRLFGVSACFRKPRTVAKKWIYWTSVTLGGSVRLMRKEWTEALRAAHNLSATAI
eukprot:gene20279-biopygen20911